MGTKEDNKPVDLQQATWGDVKGTNYSFAVLPWGATEPHNYHLPYLTDWHIAHDIAVKSVEKAWQKYQIRGMIFAPIPLGAQNPGQKELPFCIHTRFETQRMVLTDIIDSLQMQGIHRLILMNGHGGNGFKPMVRDLAFDYPEMIICVVDWFSIEAQKDYFENFDDHAGEMETSVMMHFHPEWVHLEQAGDGASTPFNIEGLNAKVGWVPRQWDKTTRDTGVGDPRKATAEKGKRYVEAVTDKIAKLMNDLVKESIY
ncbi:MAG: creatininase family protein [Dysgonamonadaceae bacterium]|jgi:creatinine amidohydrolase|nr:creatininase family protein [Dysgonamonadaceae bacterium]